jgi:hypothetical protein
VFHSAPFYGVVHYIGDKVDADWQLPCFGAMPITLT